MMIEAEIESFNQWMNMLGVVPVISALREKALAIQADTMESLERKLSHLSDRERKIISKHTKSIINQMLKDPILYVKELSGVKHRDEAIDRFIKTFNIEGLVELQKLKSEMNQAPSAKAGELKALAVEA